MKMIILIPFLLLAITNFVQAQQSIDTTRHRLGLFSGYSYQGILPVKYVYEVIFYQAQYNRAVIRDKSNWGLDLVFQPQYNTTRYKKHDEDLEKKQGYEFGVNIGLSIHRRIFGEALKFYSFGSVGPHYVSGAPKTQKPGFIFSDNFFIGLKIKLVKNTFLNLRYGIRHISNAGLYNPNGGINSLVIGGGILVDVK